MLSIGTPITSDLAFLTMFSEFGTTEGGRSARDEEYGSERFYGPKRYPPTLRMLSKEVDDVLFRRFRPLDVLVFRVPHCSTSPRGSANARHHRQNVWPESGHSVSQCFLADQKGTGAVRLFVGAGKEDLRSSVAWSGDE